MEWGVPAIGRDDDLVGSSPPRTVVLVTGIPGAGTTTVSRALSKALMLPLLSKDAIKESLFDELGVKDREWSLQLGAAANRAVWSLLCHCPAGAIVDMARSDPGCRAQSARPRACRRADGLRDHL